MLKAVVVYMALLLPFCLFLEKLLFRFVKIEHEMGMFAVMFAGNNPKGTQVAKNIFNYNVEVAKGFLWLFNMIFVWTTTLISMVTDIVKALKPL